MVGYDSNKSALGARIELTYFDKSDKLKKVFLTVNSGGSFGANSLQQEIGLADAKRIKSVKIKWPTIKNNVSIIENLDLNTFYEIHEKDDKAIKLDKVKVAF